MGVNSVPINYSISSSYTHQTNGSLGNSPTSAYGALSMNSAGLNSIQNSIFSPNYCCLIDKGVRCTAPSGNASFSKKIERQVAMKKLKLVADQRSSHSYICEQHKLMIQNVRTAPKRKRKEHDDDDLSNDFPCGSNSPPIDNGRTLNLTLNNHHSIVSGYDFDLSGFQLSALRRYKKHFRVHTKPGLNKIQLAEELTKHFKTMPVDERDVINRFMFTVKQNGNKLDFISNSKE